MKTGWHVIETNTRGDIVRIIRNLSQIEAENAYSQIVNTNPIRCGVHTVKMEGGKKK